jgi:hypothetical protein
LLTRASKYPLAAASTSLDNGVPCVARESTRAPTNVAISDGISAIGGGVAARLDAGQNIQQFFEPFVVGRANRFVIALARDIVGQRRRRAAAPRRIAVARGQIAIDQRR